MNINSFESENVAINLELFKFFRLHHIFNRKYSKSFLNFNIYRLIFFVITLITLLILLVVLFSTFTETEDTIDDIQMMKLFLIYTNYFRIILIVITCIYKANDIWNLFDVARINFLSAKNCQKHIRILHEYREKSIKITNYLCFFIIGTFIFWTLTPFVFNANSSSVPYDEVNANRRKESMFNFLFPVSVHVYNKYYFIFFFMEVFISIYMSYVNFVFNIYFISFGCTFIAQYEIIMQAFKHIGYDNNYRNTQIDKSKSIILYQT